MPKTLPFFLLTFLFCCSCARKNFFQETALVSPSERAAIAAGHIPDSVTVTVGRHYDKGFFQNLFFGKHYRKLWATPVSMPVFDMSQEKGGLKPISLGGGFQTTSLTLEDHKNRLFVLRSLDKDPQKALPKSLRGTFIVNILRDQTSAANPFAPVVLPTLSEAAGIFYTTPKLVYVTENDSSFGEFGPRILGKVMLLEEKFDRKENITPMFGAALNLVDSEELLYNRFEKDNHHVDQQLYARSRLFDILIGDWDRHEGQWQWAVYKNHSDYYYKPVPKDRDQTFYRFNDGIITRLASKLPVLKKFQTFHHHYGNLSGWLYNARFLDERALNQVTREEWLQHAEYMKNNLTDAVIEQAVEKLPAPIFKKTGPETIAKLKSRRDKLPEAALKIYKILAREVIVPGSDDKERFVITRLPSGQTRVDVYGNGKQEDETVFSRTFKPKETRKIILYGLGEEDTFKFFGEAPSAIDVHVYGGPGEDELIDKSHIKGCHKTIKVFDTRRGIEMEKTPEIKKKLSRSVKVHAFDREGL